MKRRTRDPFKGIGQRNAAKPPTLQFFEPNHNVGGGRMKRRTRDPEGPRRGHLVALGDRPAQCGQATPTLQFFEPDRNVGGGRMKRRTRDPYKGIGQRNAARPPTHR